MGRLSLAIADSDTEYLAALEKYLIVNYPQRFDIFTFSSSEKLDAYLNSMANTDILLINALMYKSELKTRNTAIILMLTGDEALPALEGFDSVKKYQHVDSITSDIMRYYASKSEKNYVLNCHGGTQVICVYSPSGGSGKSSIAAGCSVLSAGRGRKTFYLNLEDIPTTGLLFQGESNQSFSNVIFYLKGNAVNLQLKLEGAGSIDAKTGVRFFKPPENIREMGELTETDISNLLNALRSSAIYDFVFIDMSSGFSGCNTAVLKNTDAILLVLSPDDLSMLKYEQFKAGLELLERKWGTSLKSKSYMIMNRVDGKGADTCDSINPADFRRCFEIKESPCREKSREIVYILEDAAFLKDLGRIIEHLLHDTTAKTASGGGSIA